MRSPYLEPGIGIDTRKKTLRAEIHFKDERNEHEPTEFAYKTLVQMYRDEKTLSITDVGDRRFTLGLFDFMLGVCHACELGFWR
jgi:hypothetical protein